MAGRSVRHDAGVTEGCRTVVQKTEGTERSRAADEVFGTHRREDFVPINASALADALGVHRRTVLRWIAAGKIRAHRMGQRRSRWRVLPVDYERAVFAAFTSPRDARTAALLIRGRIWPAGDGGECGTPSVVP